MNTQSIQKEASVRVSALPKNIQKDARKLDVDGDGALNTNEVGTAFVNLNKTKNDNKSLKKTIVAFAVLTVLLIGCIFAASITSARLAKDIKVSSADGFAYVKGSDSNQVMKTAEALVETEGVNVGLLSNDELQRLTQIIFGDGDIKFNVIGYSRGNPTGISETIMVLVEGGTITYDDAGIIDSTGDAQALLDHALGPDVEVAASDGERRLSKSSFTTMSNPGNMYCGMVEFNAYTNARNHLVMKEAVLNDAENKVDSLKSKLGDARRENDEKLASKYESLLDKALAVENDAYDDWEKAINEQDIAKEDYADAKAQCKAMTAKSF